MKQEITQEYLKECFNYCPESGSLTWRKRPKDHFKSQLQCEAFNLKHAGQDATTDSRKGVRVVRLLGKYCYYAQRVIWAYMTGNFPSKAIKHKNAKRDDNRWLNLKLETVS